MNRKRAQHSSGGGKLTVAGIALMEVLVSVSIIAASFSTLLWSVSHCTRSQTALWERAMGRFLTEKQLFMLRAQRLPSGQEEVGGDFAPPYEAYSWKGRLESATDESPFSVVQLRVYKRAGNDEKLVSSMRTILNDGA